MFGAFLRLGNAFLILQRKSWFQLMLACSKVVEIPAMLPICLTGVMFHLPFLYQFLEIGKRFARKTKVHRTAKKEGAEEAGGGPQESGRGRILGRTAQICFSRLL